MNPFFHAVLFFNCLIFVRNSTKMVNSFSYIPTIFAVSTQKLLFYNTNYYD